MIAFLLFAIIGVIVLESTVSLRGAQSFRSKVVAQNLAESALQLSLQELAMEDDGDIEYASTDGKMMVDCTKTPLGASGGYKFEIKASGQSVGISPYIATIEVKGRTDGFNVTIDAITHSQ